jgi:hypothetical protein
MANGTINTQSISIGSTRGAWIALIFQYLISINRIVMFIRFSCFLIFNIFMA